MFRDGDLFFYNTKTTSRKRKGYQKEKEELSSLKRRLAINEKLLKNAIKTKDTRKVEILLEAIEMTKEKIALKEEEIKNLQKTNPIIHKGLKRKIKKRKNSWIKEEILKIIDERIKENKYLYLNKEDIARTLEVKECQVEQVFMELNREGYISQAIHHAPHDSKRDPWGFDCNYFWSGDIYSIYKGTKKE